MGDLAREFGAVGEPAQVVVMDENNAEWMSLYPFSAVRIFPPLVRRRVAHIGRLQFLAPYKIDLPVNPDWVVPATAVENIVVSAVNETVDAVAGTRSFTLQVYHPGVIWVGKSFPLLLYPFSLLTMRFLQSSRSTHTC